MTQIGKLVEYAPGQYGTLIRGRSDSHARHTCATCGGTITGSAIAARMGDEATVHYMTDADAPGMVLDCVTGNWFRDGMA